jgi:all-trans-8'-apo-beta-carotenal 15,15'-oxygenase
MKRRAFLHHGLLAALSAGATPAWLRAAEPVADGGTHFDAQLARHPWLAGWKTAGAETFGPTIATTEGRWPGSLTGSLYRNGPAWFDRGGVRYRHWFDGDGLMRAWHVRAGAVTHVARMLATRKFTHEQRVGRFEIQAAGTPIANPLPARNNDDVSTANTAVIRIGNRVMALWEAGSAIEIDPDTVETRGPVTWRPDLAAAPFSAHPLLERDGSAWNFGSLTFFNRQALLLWRIGADGALLKTQILETPANGYLHSFAMTERHLVFVLMPYRMLDEKGAFFERLRFAANEPCRIAVVPKDALDEPRWFESDFAMVYHFADAFERGGVITVRAMRHADIEAARSPMAAAMRGEISDEQSSSDLVNLHLDLASGRARWEVPGTARMEFPAWDGRSPGNRGAVIYAPTTFGKAEAPYFNGVTRIDLERGHSDSFNYGPRVLSEEHRFIPRPGSGRPDDGWLLGSVLDWNRGRSGIALLDARRVSDGPIATAWLPYTLPLGFHGYFT